LSAKPRETANVGAGLWKATGMWAWVLFRVSGVVLAFYLGAHIIIISTAQFGSDGETFNSLMKFFDHPVAILLDLLLVVAVIYHALNGVRIILMDFGIGIHRHKVMFWSAMAVAVICFAVFAYVAFSYIANDVGPWNAALGVAS
jgi:succinate dehydrogenase / fumarate reductase, cytochrome b subunit